MPTYKSPGVYVEQVPSGSAPIAGVGTSTAGFVGVLPDSIQIPNPEYDVAITDSTDPRSKANFTFSPPALGETRLLTNFTEFKTLLGGFKNTTATNEPWLSVFAHAIYGFFLNGGTRCFIARVKPPTGATAATDWTNTSIAPALEALEAVDEISIVVAPGLSGTVPAKELVAHCTKVKTRVAVVDTDEAYASSASPPVKDLASTLASLGAAQITSSDYLAIYFPWIQVYDPSTKLPRFVPPSGHIAGIYARVDSQRGVHKAPANETILGALDVRFAISKFQQDGLNPHGVNCIRKLNGDIKVWGARTAGGDKNAEFKYLNVRRLFNYLHASIDQGTQWAVFEPNDAELWAKITRNVSAFLKDVWSSGALFGEKPEQAFYVKCDAETNPPSLRDRGEVVTEVGVAITRPAEFVIFRLGQKEAS